MLGEVEEAPADGSAETRQVAKAPSVECQSDPKAVQEASPDPQVVEIPAISSTGDETGRHQVSSSLAKVEPEAPPRSCAGDNRIASAQELLLDEVRPCLLLMHVLCEEFSV